jgi:FtsP/CotA-like multicopper oxidase with cupredoxin domain
MQEKSGEKADLVMLPLLALLIQTPECPGSSLHCFDLVAVPGLRTVAGTVELRRVPSPFGVAVTRDGHHRSGLVLRLDGLPDPQSLGPYRAYVAWLTTPVLEPMVRLGTVSNGRTELGEVALNKYLVLVTAESSSTVGTKSGRLVLRGMSPSNLLLPIDVSDLPPAARTGEHTHADGGDGWVLPPMHPAVTTMPAGLEPLRPRVTPVLPGRGRDPASLPFARPREVVTLADEDSLDLEAVLVRRVVGGRTLVMYAFNGQYPGPLIRVPESATIVVRFRNRLDVPSSVHWHGVRLDNRFDGVPHVTQDPVPPGGWFRYEVHFPDAGLYWYHPHVREDIQQDLGLYGNLLVWPARPGYFGPAHREEFLMLDDLLVGPGGAVPYGKEHATHALMGRFGNVLLVNGEPRYRLDVPRGAVVRLFLTNASNTRTFNVSLEGMRMKLVGSDVGLFEREQWVESVVIAPAERYIVYARFERPGTVALTNRVQAVNRVAGAFFTVVDTLGAVVVDDAPAEPDLAAAFERLRERAEVTAEFARFRERTARAPERGLRLTLRTDGLPFGLVQVLRLDTAYVQPVELSGTMPMMDWLSTAREVRWILADTATGRENMRISWRFRRGQLVRIRLTNDRHTLHPMAHPIHIHGQRFLVLAVDGVPNDNLVWKDTFLLPAASTADILLELSNPGRWMLHCHIAEHLEAGMHMVFDVN